MINERQGSKLRNFFVVSKDNKDIKGKSPKKQFNSFLIHPIHSKQLLKIKSKRKSSLTQSYIINTPPQLKQLSSFTNDQSSHKPQRNISSQSIHHNQMFKSMNTTLIKNNNTLQNTNKKRKIYKAFSQKNYPLYNASNFSKAKTSGKPRIRLHIAKRESHQSQCYTRNDNDHDDDEKMKPKEGHETNNNNNRDKPSLLKCFITSVLNRKEREEERKIFNESKSNSFLNYFTKIKKDMKKQDERIASLLHEITIAEVMNKTWLRNETRKLKLKAIEILNNPLNNNH